MYVIAVQRNHPREKRATLREVVQALLGGLVMGRWKWLLALLTSVLGIVFLVLLVYHGWNLLIDASDNSPVFAISKRYWYGVMPLAGTIMIGYSLRDIWVALRTGPTTR